MSTNNKLAAGNERFGNSGFRQAPSAAPLVSKRPILHLKLNRPVDSPGESPGAIAADPVSDSHSLEEALRAALNRPKTIFAVGAESQG